MVNSRRVQIVPLPADAPRAPHEMADHPFILEFPIQEAGLLYRVTNHRRIGEHRRLTLLLNLLLVGTTRLLPDRQRHYSGRCPPCRNSRNTLCERVTGFSTVWVADGHDALTASQISDGCKNSTSQSSAKELPTSFRRHPSTNLRRWPRMSITRLSATMGLAYACRMILTIPFADIEASHRPCEPSLTARLTG